jgi:hypothetical protein
MRYATFILSALVVALCIVGCAKQVEITGDQLIATLKSNGSNVTKEVQIHPSIQGAIEGFWLNIDGNRVTAFRFNTYGQANMKAKSYAQGLAVGAWAFEHVDPQSAEKLKALVAKK